MTEKFSGGFVVVEKVIIESVNVGFKPIYVRQDGLSGLSDYVVGQGRGARQYDCWSRLVIYFYIRLFSVEPSTTVYPQHFHLKDCNYE